VLGHAPDNAQALHVILLYVLRYTPAGVASADRSAEWRDVIIARTKCRRMAQCVTCHPEPQWRISLAVTGHRT